MRKSVVLFLMAVFCLSVLVTTGCGGSSSSSSGPAAGAIVGSVKATDGTPISGATVSVAGGTPVTTDSTGAFEVIAPIGRARVEASFTGYIRSASFVDVVGGTVATSIVMRPTSGVQATVTLSNASTTDNTATNTARTDNNKARVEFPAGTIVDDSGKAVDDVTVEIANSVVTDTGYADAFPGLFMGVATGSTEATSIESFGYLDVNMSDAAGNALKIGEGEKATIYIPADPDPVGENTIPLWRLDEDTGVWEQTGTATRVTGTNLFKAEVERFSSYNLDRAFDGGELHVFVKEVASDHDYHDEWNDQGTTPRTNLKMSMPDTISGTPVAGALVKVDVTNSTTGLTTGATWQGRAVTDSTGKAVFATVPAGDLQIVASKGGKSGSAWAYNVSTTGLATSTVYFYTTVTP